MEEKRRNKRLELTVTLKLEYLDEAVDETRSKYVEIQVIDLSRSGIGFSSAEKLDPDGFYDTKMEIWTKEIIPCVIHIIRERDNGDGTYQYGGIFTGMNDIDKRKIDIYQMFEEAQNAGQQSD